MSLTTIAVTPLQDLLSETERAPAGLQVVAEVSAAGSYRRRAPVRMDLQELDPDQQELMAAYLAREVQEYGPVRHVVLRDALVTGQGSVVTADFRLLRESAAEFLAHGVTPTNFQTLEDDRLALNLDNQRYVEAPSLLVKRPWYRNYGHWMVDGAALLSLAWKMNLPSGWQIVIGDLGPGSMRSIVHQTLATLAPRIATVEHPDGEVWRFKELHYVSPLSIPPLFKAPESLNYLRAAFLHGQLAEIETQPGLFITRGASPVRRLVNEAEVAGLCRSMGLSVIAPESLTLAEQARLFRNARVVVGVKGASLTNALFCAPSAHVIALSPGDFPDPFFWDVVAQNGVGYSEIFGALQQRSSRQGSNAFAIDLAKFASLMEESVR